MLAICNRPATLPFVFTARPLFTERHRCTMVLSGAGITVQRPMSARRKRCRERKRRQYDAQTRPHANELVETAHVKRLAYSRRQAAEALGVSISTIDRRVVPAVDTVKTPWGQRLIPVDELERFVKEHMEPAAPTVPRRPADAGRRRFRNQLSIGSASTTSADRASARSLEL